MTRRWSRAANAAGQAGDRAADDAAALGGAAKVTRLAEMAAGVGSRPAAPLDVTFDVFIMVVGLTFIVGALLGGLVTFSVQRRAERARQPLAVPLLGS